MVPSTPSLHPHQQPAASGHCLEKSLAVVPNESNMETLKTERYNAATLITNEIKKTVKLKRLCYLSGV